MIEYSAIDLQMLLAIYETDVLPYEFFYHLKNGNVLNVAFEQSQLSHLLGIQKVDYSIASLKGQACFCEIKNGNLTFAKLKSIHRKRTANECKDKMRYFDELPNLLNQPECIVYDSQKAARSSSIKMAFALHQKDKAVSHRLILGIDTSANLQENGVIRCFPRTWVIEKIGKTSLLDGQQQIDIVSIEKKRRGHTDDSEEKIN